MGVWRLVLLVAALAGSTAAYLWLLFVAPHSPRVSLLMLLAVFLIATAVAAWHHRERLTARLLSAHLALGSLVLAGTATLVYWGERFAGPAFLPGQSLEWHYLVVGLLGIGATFVTWTRARGRAEVVKVAVPADPAQVEPPPPASALLDDPVDWAALVAAFEARGDQPRLRQLRTLQRIHAVADGDVGDTSPAERLQSTLRTVRQEVRRLDAESTAHQEASEEDALSQAADLLEWGVQKLPELGRLDVSDLIMAKTVADIHALHQDVEHIFVDHRELLAIHPIDRGNSGDKTNQRAAALQAALPIVQANAMRLSEDLIAATPELEPFHSVTGFQVVSFGERGYVTFEGNGRREAIRRALGDEPLQVEVRLFRFPDPEIHATIVRRVERVRRWKGVTDRPGSTATG